MVLEIYNDFLVDVQHESNDRLYPQAMLPIWDMDFTVAEMTRLLDKGMTGFTLSDKPEMVGLPELWEPYYEPMWDIFNESGAVANFHIAAGMSRAEIEAIRSARFKRSKAGGAKPSKRSCPDRSPRRPTCVGRVRAPARHGGQRYAVLLSNVRIIATCA